MTFKLEPGKFWYVECPECGFDEVLHADHEGQRGCTLCAEDNGHYVLMCFLREATDDDKVEGVDVRPTYANP